ncbi:MAG: hypothetical protein CM15mP74_17990 [Halieaceae bacterium]|nr:MAG: hypothetical protein CM15mP74_17990 [Halieaceae bacterium]
MLVDVLSSLDEARHTAAIKAQTIELIASTRPSLACTCKGICQLHLAIATGRRAANDVKNVWRQNVASDHRKVGRCLVLGGFSTISVTRVSPAARQYPQSRHICRFPAWVLLVPRQWNIRTLDRALPFGTARRGHRGSNKGRRTTPRQGLSANQRLTGQNSVAEPQHLSLAHHGEDAAIDDIADALEILLL